MVGNTGGNPTKNTLFTTLNTSGWLISSTSAKTASGKYLYVSRTNSDFVNFFEVQGWSMLFTLDRLQKMLFD
jgi:hypothetical protein